MGSTTSATYETRFSNWECSVTRITKQLEKLEQGATMNIGLLLRGAHSHLSNSKIRIENIIWGLKTLLLNTCFENNILPNLTPQTIWLESELPIIRQDLKAGENLLRIALSLTMNYSYRIQDVGKSLLARLPEIEEARKEGQTLVTDLNNHIALIDSHIESNKGKIRDILHEIASRNEILQTWKADIKSLESELISNLPDAIRSWLSWLKGSCYAGHLDPRILTDEEMSKILRDENVCLGDEHTLVANKISAAAIESPILNEKWNSEWYDLMNSISKDKDEMCQLNIIQRGCLDKQEYMEGLWSQLTQIQNGENNISLKSVSDLRYLAAQLENQYASLHEPTEFIENLLPSLDSLAKQDQSERYKELIFQRQRDTFEMIVKTLQSLRADLNTSLAGEITKILNTLYNFKVKQPLFGPIRLRCLSPVASITTCPPLKNIVCRDAEITERVVEGLMDSVVAEVLWLWLQILKHYTIFAFLSLKYIYRVMLALLYTIYFRETPEMTNYRRKLWRYDLYNHYAS